VNVWAEPRNADWSRARYFGASLRIPNENEPVALVDVIIVNNNAVQVGFPLAVGFYIGALSLPVSACLCLSLFLSKSCI